MTSFAWLDYSEFERKQFREVIDLFREEDTRDELGLGTIRDTFADLLFPGTSTIQTRVRYFLFVPWIYSELERQRIKGHEVPRRSRILQGRLRDGLIAGGEEVGVIGSRVGLHVQRLPSSVYWFGLRRWGILRADRSEEDYQRELDRYYYRRDTWQNADAGESPEAAPANWDRHLPQPPENFLSSVTFQLRPVDAEYLQHRIVDRAPRSMLAHLLLTNQPIGDEPFAWQLPQDHLEKTLAAQLLHAQNFSETMHGAALLYNLILAEQKPNADWAEQYREQLELWWSQLRARKDELVAWNRDAFWAVLKQEGGRVSMPTRGFVDAWLNLTNSAQSLSQIIAARQLVIDRELLLKKGRARVGNRRALEMWNGASGNVQLDYRWSRPVRDLVNDIVGALDTKGLSHA